jgi:hypothetical protein
MEPFRFTLELRRNGILENTICVLKGQDRNRVKEHYRRQGYNVYIGAGWYFVRRHPDGSHEKVSLND